MAVAQLYTLSETERSSRLVERAADMAWQYIGQFVYFREKAGLPLDGGIPEISLEAAEKRAAIGKEILNLLDQADDALLSHDAGLTSRLVRFYAENWAKDADRYWLAYDIMGILYYGPFIQTAYTGGFVFKYVSAIATAFPFAHEGDVDRYMSLMFDIGRMLKQIHDRTEGQAERGIRINKPQIPAVRELLVGLKAQADAIYRVGAERLSALANPDEAADLISRRIDELVLPQFDALINQLDDDYEKAAPSAVGMDKHPGGAEVYKELLQLHTTTTLTPEEVHQRGHERMARIEADMQKVRDQLGFKGTAAEFAVYLRQQPGAVAETPEGVGEKMRHHKNRVEERFDEFFAERSPFDYDLLRLDEALEGSMTWGFYQAPMASEPRGLYRFNGSKLDSQAVIGAGALVFHELVPGHHLQITLQAENDCLHPFRRYARLNAYDEGWAEYAAELTGEMGLYDDPYDRYGRYIMDSFLTSRLVVDTGMNALGWSHEQAMTYMAQHTLCNETEIYTDTLRYSCSIPGQALAYKLGDEAIMDMREKMQDRLQNKFDFRAFHSAILKVGSIPIPVLEWHLDWYTDQQLSA